MELFVAALDFLQTIPKEPGIYRFYGLLEDKSEELLYVGKALSLRHRIKSYFQKSATHSPRISLMIAKIYRIEITVTENEVSALILENNLIKSLKPKYNIIFRDDKTYPLIRLTKHKFPKLESTRSKPNQVDTFLGPFPNSYAVSQNLDVIGRLFRLRTCTDNDFSNRSRPCMLYQIKRCQAPCVDLISTSEYKHQVNLAVDFLNGKYEQVIQDLTMEMNELAINMEFEKAAVVRDKIGMIKQISKTQIINNYKEPVSADLVVCDSYAKKIFIYLIILRNGIYVGDKHFILDNPDDDINTVFEAFMEGYYLEGHNIRNVFTSFIFKSEFISVLESAAKIKISQKMNSQIEKLYQMGKVNLLKIIEQYASDRGFSEAVNRLKVLLSIDKIERIECIDVSHNQGDSTVASLVVYEGGIIDSSKYRRYNLSTDLEGNPIVGNDILAMSTVMKRRLASKELMLPDVFLVDGGLNQLSVVKNILDSMGLCDKIRVVAIFKGERRDPQFDRIILPDGSVRTYHGERQLFRLLQSLRDEAHRFAISGHRKKQAKKMLSSKLNDIPNIGAKKKQALIASFGSVKEVANASVEDLSKVKGIGVALANQIYMYFH